MTAPCDPLLDLSPCMPIFTGTQMNSQSCAGQCNINKVFFVYIEDAKACNCYSVDDSGGAPQCRPGTGVDASEAALSAPNGECPQGIYKLVLGHGSL